MKLFNRRRWYSCTGSISPGDRPAVAVLAALRQHAAPVVVDYHELAVDSMGIRLGCSEQDPLREFLEDLETVGVRGAWGPPRTEDARLEEERSSARLTSRLEEVADLVANPPEHPTGPTIEATVRSMLDAVAAVEPPTASSQRVTRALEEAQTRLDDSM